MATLSFHAGPEGKITRKNIRSMTGHTFRASEKRFKNHGNKDIDPARTHMNYDAFRGGKLIEEQVTERLERDYKGRRKVNDQSILIREVIIQASPDVYEGLTDEQKQAKAIQFSNDSMGWFVKEFGVENVLGFSVHMDETNPHTHVEVMPMTKDGRLSQKDFFKSPADLKRQHREYREFMIEKGWDFDIENKYENVDGVSLPKYKANAVQIERKREEQALIMAELESTPDVRQEALEAVMREIRGEVLLEERAELEEREKRVSEREEKAKLDRASFLAHVNEVNARNNERAAKLREDQAKLDLQLRESRIVGVGHGLMLAKVSKNTVSTGDPVAAHFSDIYLAKEGTKVRLSDKRERDFSSGDAFAQARKRLVRDQERSVQSERDASARRSRQSSSQHQANRDSGLSR